MEATIRTVLTRSVGDIAFIWSVALDAPILDWRHAGPSHRLGHQHKMSVRKLKRGNVMVQGKCEMHHFGYRISTVSIHRLEEIYYENEATSISVTGSSVCTIQLGSRDEFMHLEAKLRILALNEMLV